jgi:hypothetical protein
MRTRLQKSRTVHTAFRCLQAWSRPNKMVQRKNDLFVAKNATDNFEVRRINSIFVAKHATNESLYISTRRLAQFQME